MWKEDPDRRDAAGVAIAAAICAGVFAAIMFTCRRKYLCLDPTHFDLGHILRIFELIRQEGLTEAVRAYPLYPLFFIQEPGHLVGLFFYRLLPSPYTLFALQAGSLSIGLFFSFLILRRITKKNWVALAGLAALAMNPYLWTFPLLGWRSYLLSVPFYMAFLHAELRGKTRLAVVFLVMAGLGKIPMMLTSALLGLALWVLPPRSKTGRPAFLWCSGSLVVIVAISMALKTRLNLEVTTEMLHLSVYGDTLGEVAGTLLRRPGFVLEQIFSRVNLCHAVFLASFLFIPPLAGRYFFCALPELALLLLSTTSLAEQDFYRNVYPHIYRSAVYIHNNHFFLTGLLMGSFSLGLGRLYNAFQRKPFGIMTPRFLVVSVLFLSAMTRLLWPPMIGGPLLANIHYDSRYSTQSRHDRMGWEIAESIPKGASLRAQWNLYPEGVSRGRAFVRAFEWYQDDIVEDFIFVDLFAFEYLQDRKLYLDVVERCLRNPNYGVKRFFDGYLLLEKGRERWGNEEVLRFISSKRQILEKNFFRPYRDRFLPDPEPGRGLYSATQKIP